MRALIKYREFLSEKLNTSKLINKIKPYDRIEQWVIFDDLKELSNILANDFKDDPPKSKIIDFSGVKINFILKKSNKYYSNVNWFEFITSGAKTIILEYPDNYNIGYLISYIIHEIRHLIDFTSENVNNGLSSFDMEFKLRTFKDDQFYEFYYRFYLSLQHEMIARSNQIYPIIINNDEVYYNNSFIAQSFDLLNNFNVNEFIEKYDINDITEKTNRFIKEILFSNDVIETKDELYNFYEMFNSFFKERSETWKEISKREISMSIKNESYNENYDFVIILQNYYDNLINFKWR